MPQINVSINTSPTQTATTDSNGNFSFASVPNGSYTLTPSISAPSAIFSPTSLAVTVNGAAVTGQNYALQLAYNLSGYVSYTGSQTGRVYLWLADSCNSRQVGTSITAAQLTSGGAFTIHGVPPGSYTLWAKMDAQGNGFPINESFPVGKTTGVTVSTASITNATVAMSDPASYAITATPGLLAVSPMDLGVVVDYNAIIGTDSNGLQVEVPPYYQIQWSTSTSWPSPTTTNSYVFPASAGDGAGIVIMNNATSGVSGNPFTNGVPYYFRMRGYISSGNAGNGGWTYFGGSSAATATPVTIGTLAGANTVSGQVTFTGTAKGPLYVGFFSPSTGQMYGEHIASPVSPQSYTVQVPTGTGYYFVGIVDNNNDGLIDAGDFADTRGSGGPPLASISASQSGLNMVIPATNTVITVTTQNSKVTNPVTTFTNYGIYFDLRYSNNEPVAVQLLSGPNIVTPVDIARCSTCGAVQFQYGNGVPGSGPSVGDTYTFNITYIDGTSEQLTGTVATLLSAYATALIPQQTTFGVSTTPTFSWNYPTNASSYTYQLSLWDNSGNQIWQIPSSSTKSSGFTSTQIPSTSGGTGISWGVDPTNSSNKPTITTLTSGTTYNWSVETIDANGNTASRQIWFTP
jgi:hypothetical protein